MELAGHGNTESEFSTEVGEDDFVVPITKAEFEDAAVFPLRQKLTDPIDRIFRQKGVDIQKEGICEIVMVGGSARIPIVQQIIQEYFPASTDFFMAPNPDESIA